MTIWNHGNANELIPKNSHGFLWSRSLAIGNAKLLVPIPCNAYDSFFFFNFHLDYFSSGQLSDLPTSNSQYAEGQKMKGQGKRSNPSAVAGRGRQRYVYVVLEGRILQTCFLMDRKMQIRNLHRDILPTENCTVVKALQILKYLCNWFDQSQLHFTKSLIVVTVSLLV